MLDDKSKKLIFVGYDDKSKAYRLYNPAENKVEISRDVPIVGDIRGKAVMGKPELREDEESGPVIFEDGETSGSGSGTTGNGPASLESSGAPRNPRYRSIEDIYNQGEVHMVCLLADAENITFSEAINDKKWVKAMEEEIGAIEKN